MLRDLWTLGDCGYGSDGRDRRVAVTSIFRVLPSDPRLRFWRLVWLETVTMCCSRSSNPDRGSGALTLSVHVPCRGRRVMVIVNDPFAHVSLIVVPQVWNEPSPAGAPIGSE